MAEKEWSEEVPEAVSGTDSDQDQQDYFEQLASVKDSILEGVITYW